MGGSAFKQDGLYTPRMPEKTYKHVLNTCKARLRTLYAYVDSAVEGPGKTDHGDIDIAVVAHNSQAPPTREQLTVLLGAYAVKKAGGSNTTNFAIPWPAADDEASYTNASTFEMEDTTKRPLDLELEKALSLVDEETSGSRDKPEEHLSTKVMPDNASYGHLPLTIAKQASSEIKYVQVDVHTSPSLSALRMLLFVQAHGDFWSIIGITIRRLGLTCSESGLYIRIAEIESYSKRLCRIELTNDPSKILGFLGFDENIYWSCFNSPEEMMDYASTCRFYDPTRGGDKGIDQLTAELKHNDRQRAFMRPTFQVWFEQYLPNHRHAQPGKDSQMTREDVVREVFHFFGERVQQEFEERKRTTLRIMDIDKLWAGFRKQLPVEGIAIGEVMRGLKRIVVTEAEGCRLEELTMVQMAYVDGHWDQIIQWAMQNWKEVGENQKRVEKKNCAVHFAKLAQGKK